MIEVPPVDPPAQDEPEGVVELSPLDGTDDVRVHGLSVEDLARRLDEGPETVRLVDAEPITRPMTRPITRPVDPADLSTQEAEIVRRIALGLSNDAIAAEMFLSINTVKSHIRSAYRKMRVETRTQAVLWAIEHGLDQAPEDEHD